MQDKDYVLSSSEAPAPARKIMGLPAGQLGVGVLVALGCFLYAYGIETQEFICSFGASDRETPELGLIIIGLGRVGRKLLDELLETTMHSELNAIEPVPGGPRFRILCLGDSTATLCSTRPYVEPVTVDVAGIDARQLAAVLHHKQDERLPIRQFHFIPGRQALFRDALTAVESMPHHLPGGGHIVVVDLSGSELTGPALVAARRAGFGSVIANKKVLAGSQALYNGISGPHMWNEATVGSAVPVVTSLRRLLMTGDHLHRIEGVLSGTIEFILGAMQRPLNNDPMFEVRPGGESEHDDSSNPDREEGQQRRRLTFSQAVAEAVRRGYAETDPREDLSGLDVARKTLIIARMQGWDVELEDIEHEPLVGRWGGAASALPLEQWMAGLAEKEDERWAARVAAAEEKGHVLRYVMSLERTTPPHTPGQMWHNRPDEIGLATVCTPHRMDQQPA
jgi:homoserine dehydrogenase